MLAEAAISKPKAIDSLTGFRFITALAIFLFHTHEWVHWRTPWEPADLFFEHGAVFMTGFFVLSGFIMAHVYQHAAFTEPKAIGNYYLKRIAKIYPAYAVASVAYPCLVGFINNRSLQR